LSIKALRFFIFLVESAEEEKPLDVTLDIEEKKKKKVNIFNYC